MITITEKASNKIKELLGEDPEAKGLRVYVRGGGCHGFEYGMLLEINVTEDDNTFEQNGVSVIVDPQSLPLLAGSEVDYSDSLMGAGFQIKNPTAKSTCGCGSSFS